MIEEFLNEKEINTWRRIKRWGKISSLGIAGLVGITTSFYTVPSDSQAVVQRFGKYARTSESGLNFKLPFGLESAKDVPIRSVQKEEFGFRTFEPGTDKTVYVDTKTIDNFGDDNFLKKILEDAGIKPSSKDLNGLRGEVKKLFRDEYLALTGDLNMVDAEWVIQYKIVDPVAYLFNVKNPRLALRDVSLEVMKQKVGNGSVDEAISLGQLEYERLGKEGIQKVLDSYKSGLLVTAVQMQHINPPIRVQPAYQAVNKAQQEKETLIYKARQEVNEKIPRTMGEANATIETAKGYALQRVNEAQGNVMNYDATVRAYREFPEITRDRFYVESMKKVLPKVKAVTITEQKGAEGGILLNLGIQSGSEEVKK